MIIDTHLHLGKFGDFSMSEEQLIGLMNKNGIDKGIVSTVACCEFYNEPRELVHEQVSQIEANSELLEILKRHRGRLYGAFWCRPYTENNILEVEVFLRGNADIFKALKLHPFYSNLPLGHKKYEPYFELAHRLSIPVCVHTAGDNLSSPEMLYRTACSHPDVNFIMVHMGLGTDNEDAIQFVARCSNLYGDTTWVPEEKAEKALAICGSKKILFGTDAPIDDERSYDFYQGMLRRIRKNEPGWNDIAENNAMRLFKI